MKKYFCNKFFPIAAILSLVIFSSCSDSGSDSPDQPLPAVPDPEIPIDAPDYTVVSETVYTAEDIASRISSQAMEISIPGLGNLTDKLKGEFLKQDARQTSEMKERLGEDADPRSRYHEIVIHYTSIDHRNRPITLSGIVNYLGWEDGDTGETIQAVIGDVVLENHFTITAATEAPTVDKSFMSMMKYNLPVLYISGDYQGYGASADYVHPYLNEALTARQQVDFLKVALNYVQTQSDKVKLENVSTYNLGYSQGGAVSVAVHKYLEENELALCRKINFRGTIAGDGPYDLEATLNAYMEDGVVAMPVVLPLIIRGMMVSYPQLFEGMEIEDFLSADFLACGIDGLGLIETIDRKTLNTLEYDALLEARMPWAKRKGGWDMASLLTDKAMAADSPEFKALSKAFALNNVITGWTPAYPIYFSHVKDDEVVPFSNLDILKTSDWPSDIYKIHKERLVSTHMLGGIMFYANIALSETLEEYFSFTE